MGFWRDLGVGVLRGALDSLQKAGGPPPGLKDKDDGKGPPGAQDGPPGAAGPPPPPPPPPRDMPEPTVGTGPTLAAPAIEPSTPKLSPGALQRVGPSGGMRGVGDKNQRLAELEAAARDPKGLYWDPFAVHDALGYKDRPSAVTYNTLTEMVWRCPVAAAIINTRVNQVFSFGRVQESKYDLGFRVTLKNAKQKPTPASIAESERLERWLLTTGTTKDPRGRDSFGTYLKKIVRDSLTYDQACTEIVPARSGKPAQFLAIDARTIRIADTTKLFIPESDTESPRHVQVYDGMVTADWPLGELAFGVRNPTPDIRMQGYGQSELEWLIGTITAILFAWDYNKNIFTNGTNARGIINFKGVVADSMLEAFKLHWYAMTSGIENAFKTPIVSAEDLQYVNLQNTNRDMEFSAWFDFLIKIACAIYGIDPMEINFKYGDSGGAGKQMFESANASKLSASKDRGLKPLLVWLEDYLTSNLISVLNEDFVVRFVGLDASTPNERADLNTKLVKSIKTVNECRADDDLPPLPNGLGDVILDAAWMDHLKLAQATQQQIDAANHAAENGLDANGQPMDQDNEEGEGRPPELDDGSDIPEVPRDDPASPAPRETEPTSDPDNAGAVVEKSRRRKLRFEVEV